MTNIYLDHAATTPVAPAVVEAMLPHLGGGPGNPSAVHAHGRAARHAVDAARDGVAAVLRCAHREVVFTASGTEADNLALRGVLERWGRESGRHLVVSAIEHDAVLETARRLEQLGAADVTVVGCDGSGRVDPDAVAAAVRRDTVLVSLMLVNNETGAVQDVAAAAAAVRAINPRTLIHTDAVQAAGRLAVRPAELDVDLLTLSAHKVHGPQGVGALWVRGSVFLAAQLTGGGQERGRRSGTENVAGIVGFAVALALAEELRPATTPQLERLAARLVDGVMAAVPGARASVAASHRAGGFAALVLPGCRTDLMLTALDGLGVSASGGSACSSGAPTPSHVLTAMGFTPDLAACALRCTLGRDSTEAEVDAAIRAISLAAGRIRAMTTAA